MAAKGKYIVWGGDDGWFLEGKLEKALDLLEASKKVNKALVSVYREGQNNGLGDGADLSIYTCNHHVPLKSKFNKDSWLVFNSAIVQTSDWKRLGGFDCRLQVPASSIAEYGIRSQRDNCQVIMFNETTFECDWLCGEEGDHGPIHHAQLEEDIPLLNEILNHPTSPERTKIDINNWGASPHIWEKRFSDPNKKSKEKQELFNKTTEWLGKYLNSSSEPMVEVAMKHQIIRMQETMQAAYCYNYLKNLVVANPDESTIVNQEVERMLDSLKINILNRGQQ
jgi:hypothetical protein